MILPEQRQESNTDDTQGTVDIDSLVNQFIVPIDTRRSFAMAQVLDTPVSNDGAQVISRALDMASFDASDMQESRAHAYYRIIGLPVIASDGTFYNPGFDPLLTADQRTKNSNVSSKVPLIVRQITKAREDAVKNRTNVFYNSSVDSSVYCLAMGVFPSFDFKLIKSEVGVLERDPQTYSIPDRKTEIESNYTKSNGSDISKFFESGTHILKPFCVDPNIESVVQDTRRIIAAPFHKSESDRRVDRGVIAPRPGIEFVIRHRFRQAQGLTQEELASMDGQNSALTTLIGGDISSSDIRQIASYIYDISQIQDSNVIDLISKTGTIELGQLDKYVKTINGLIEELINSYFVLANVSQKIKWKPLPSEKGPEFGVTMSDRVKVKSNVSTIDYRIDYLNMLSALSKRQGKISDDDSIKPSDFAISQFENVEKTYDEELDEETRRRDSIASSGFRAMKNIELIKGEVSGIGLIDIIAIYMALWAIDKSVLVSMLDDRTFARLYDNNADLRVQEVADRKTSGKAVYTIVEAMKKFEDQVGNILGFADSRLKQRLGSPVDAEGGQPA